MFNTLIWSILPLLNQSMIIIFTFVRYLYNNLQRSWFRAKISSTINISNVVEAVVKYHADEWIHMPFIALLQFEFLRFKNGFCCWVVVFQILPPYFVLSHYHILFQPIKSIPSSCTIIFFSLHNIEAVSRKRIYSLISLAEIVWEFLRIIYVQSTPFIVAVVVMSHLISKLYFTHNRIQV